jgi:hypothetical protein
MLHGQAGASHAHAQIDLRPAQQQQEDCRAVPPDRNIELTIRALLGLFQSRFNSLCALQATSAETQRTAIAAGPHHAFSAQLLVQPN